MRSKFFIWVKRRFGITTGQVLPNWALFIRFLLFPIRMTRWWIEKGEGYQCMTDTWIIHGIEYSDVLFAHLANDNRWYRVIKRENGLITIETK